MLTMKNVREGMKEVLVRTSGPDDLTFVRAIIDSRQAGPGDLFFALPGERVDGHEFVGKALAAGAAGAVVERSIEAPDHAAIFEVRDGLEALQRLASYWRRRHNLRVIATTGSVGKTTCKELIAAVLARRFKVLKSEANLNTEIGVPLTLLQLHPEHERAVLEFGMYGPGEIALLSTMAQPYIGVVTNVGPVHLERLGTIEAIADAKAELVEALPARGFAVLNGDDPRVAAFAQRTKARTITYGQAAECDVRGIDLISKGLDGISFTLSHDGSSTRISCPLSGRHHVYPCLAAAAVGLIEGMGLEEITEALGGVRPELRLRIHRTPEGWTILDDSYNASPASMLAALDLLAELPGRRLALLGEMRELGAAEVEGHREVGRKAASVCDLLLVAGERAQPLAEAAKEAGLRDVRFFQSTEALAATLANDLTAGDYLLVKASRGMALETVVEALLAR